MRDFHPLTLGEIDKEVQAYIKVLKKAGTYVSIQVVLAAAEGIYHCKNLRVVFTLVWLSQFHSLDSYTIIQVINHEFSV